MGQIFISHVAEDEAIARILADGLQKAGYQPWFFEESSVPGLSYVDQIVEAIAASSAVVVILSDQALTSHQLEMEIVRAHESGTALMPLLSGLRHEDFGRRRPSWRAMMGAAVAVSIPPTTADVVPRLIVGLRRLELEQSQQQEPPQRAPADEEALQPDAPRSVATPRMPVSESVPGTHGGSGTQPGTRDTTSAIASIDMRPIETITARAAAPIPTPADRPLTYKRARIAALGLALAIGFVYGLLHLASDDGDGSSPPAETQQDSNPVAPPRHANLPAAPANPDAPAGRDAADCTVLADATPDAGAAPLTVEFTAETDCTGAPVKLTWDFGDGSRRTHEENPSHVYKEAGDYVATVTASTPDGGSAEDSIDISIE